MGIFITAVLHISSFSHGLFKKSFYFILLRSEVKHMESAGMVRNMIDKRRQFETAYQTSSFFAAASTSQLAWQTDYFLHSIPGRCWGFLWLHASSSYFHSARASFHQNNYWPKLGSTISPLIVVDRPLPQALQKKSIVLLTLHAFPCLTGFSCYNFLKAEVKPPDFCTLKNASF